MEPAPRLLKTYEEARLLFEAKGWDWRRRREHLSEMPEMARFHISHTKLSKKATPETKFPIEPEVAAAVEGMETRAGYERQTEIVTAGLRALHGDSPLLDVGQLAAELRERFPADEFVLKLVEALEEKASQRADSFFQKLAERFGRVSRKQIAIFAGSGALVGCCLALAVAPLLPGRANAAFQAGPPVVIVSATAADDSPVWLRFEPGSLVALADPGGTRPAEQYVPKSTLPGQKVAPCDEGLRQEAIYGNCWLPIVGAPPCGRLFRHGDKCYAPVAAEPKKPAP